MARVLVNGLSARLGGGQTYLLNLLRHIPTDGSLDVALLCPDNLDISNLPDVVRRIPGGRGLDNPFRRALWEANHLGPLARSLGADLLFSPGGMLPETSLGEVKTAVTFQNMLPFDHVQRKRYPYGYRRLRDWLLERAFSSSMRRADLVVFISCFAQRYIERLLGQLPGSTVVVPHGIDPVFFGDERPAGEGRGDLIPASPYFLYVSFVDYYKSQIEVVQAYYQVREATGTTIPLLLVGAGYAPYGKKLRAEVQRLGLSDAVRITGNLPHASLPGLYRNAEINVFASCTENCPNILLEMMAAGRPALVSSRGPMPEFGRDAVTYFDPSDVSELAKCWVRLIRQPEAAQRLSSRAVEMASSYTWAKAAGDTWGAIAATARGAA